ncbi:hypothetical protein EG329_005454 [Mollisiaceae sp. DMI_Dod_QoI]|nr:hypothetical protein EG329_005454 [Helotiales sp. DMI_Dod_QoI]
MAEVLAIVASGAGLASLAIQLADGIDRLRNRYENLEKLRDNIGTLIEDLEIIVEQLHNLEVDHIEIIEFKVAPIALGRCQAGCKNVIRRLETLIAGMPSTSSGGSKTRILRTLFKSKRWKIEFEELRSEVHGLQLNFIKWVSSPFGPSNAFQALIKDIQNPLYSPESIHAKTYARDKSSKR